MVSGGGTKRPAVEREFDPDLWGRVSLQRALR